MRGRAPVAPCVLPISFERTLVQGYAKNQHLQEATPDIQAAPFALRVAFKTHLAGRDGAVSAREAEFME